MLQLQMQTSKQAQVSALINAYASRYPADPGAPLTPMDNQLLQLVDDSESKRVLLARLRPSDRNTLDAGKALAGLSALQQHAVDGAGTSRERKLLEAQMRMHNLSELEALSRA